MRDYGSAAPPQAVAPGGELTLDLTIKVPSRPGQYQLEFDMVSDYLTWFEDAGFTTPLVHFILVQ